MIVSKELRFRISVALATYNGEKFIKEQLMSIYGQSVPVDEIIIGDDGSSDKTVEIVNSIKKVYKLPITLINNSNNVGYIRNFKNIISRTTGDIVFLADQDDIWETNKVKLCIEKMKETDSSLICTDFATIDAQGSCLQGKQKADVDSKMRIVGMKPLKKGVLTKEGYITLKSIMWQNYFPGCTMCFDKTTKEAFLSIFSPALPHDYQLLLCAVSRNKAYYFDSEQIRYRMHTNNTIGTSFSNKGSKKIVSDMNKYIAKLSNLSLVEKMVFHSIYLFRIQKIYSKMMDYQISRISGVVL